MLTCLLPPAAAAPPGTSKQVTYLTHSLDCPPFTPRAGEGRQQGLVCVGGGVFLCVVSLSLAADRDISILVKLFKFPPELPLPRLGELSGEETLTAHA